MKGLITVVFAVSALTLGCAGTQAVRSDAASVPRGFVEARGHTAKAIVQGPHVIHAYSADAGGDLYVAPALTGTDADCGMVPLDAASRPVSIRREQRVELTVEAGEVACLATSKTRNFELLWHGHGEGKQTVHQIHLARATSDR